MRSPRERLRQDDGAALVELAFVGPILFFLLIGLLDLGLTVLGKAVASGAARDGARVGIIHFEDADNPGSPNRQLIEDAVMAKLTGHIADSPVVTVECLDGGTKLPKATGCDRAGIAVDHDLIEVTVDWTSIAIDSFGLIPTNHTERARMVITGDGEPSGATAPVDCSDSSVDLALSTGTPPSAQETDVDVTTDLTIVRTGANLDCWSQVTYTTGGGTATAGSDYEAQTDVVVIFPPTITNQTITLVIKGDNSTEPTETFDVTLTASTGGTIVAPATATVTIVDDDGPPPALTSLRFFDANPVNGKVDSVVAVFDQALSATCPNPAAFVVTAAPSGGTRGAVTIAGNTATIAVNEGAGAHDTAGPGFLVRLDPGCLSGSGSGAAVSFPDTAPADRAGPFLLSVADGNGSIDGQAEANDWVRFTFSENMAAAVGPTVVTEGPGATGQLSINGIITTTNLNPKNRSEYAIGGDLIFTDSGVTTSGPTVTVTLGSCTTTCSVARQGQSDERRIAFTASPSLTDLATPQNSATGTFTTGNNYRLF